MMSPQIEEAMAILGQDPLPADARARLEQLERETPPEEAALWGDLWEGFTAAGGSDL